MHLRWMCSGAKSIVLRPYCGQVQKDRRLGGRFNQFNRLSLMLIVGKRFKRHGQKQHVNVWWWSSSQKTLVPTLAKTMDLLSQKKIDRLVEKALKSVSKWFFCLIGFLVADQYWQYQKRGRKTSTWQFNTCNVMIWLNTYNIFELLSHV